MKTLRAMKQLRWCVLVWFALFLGVAVASPLVQPKSMDVVCSNAGGIKLVFQSDEAPAKHGGMDCPLCLLEATPPEPPHARLPALSPLACQPMPLSCVHTVVAMATPPPARAPPFFLSHS